MHVSAGRVTPVLSKGVQTGGGWSRRTPEVLQMTAAPVHVPVGVVAVKDT